MKRRLSSKDLAFLARERVVRVAATGRDGWPWVVPVCHAIEGGAVYFGSDKNGLKVRNIARTRRAAVVADRYRDTWRGLRGVALAGPARIFSRGPEFERGVRLLYRKYRQYERVAGLEAGDSVIIRVTPQRVMSWHYDQ
jgi:nitroimidazol reductase NimA-like FMN-containing flavoprotein (pyridoxamine 5'-phosphate oxidase superfamily)